MTDDTRCSEMLSGSGTWGYLNKRHCERKATVTVDGKRYCSVHNPEVKKKRRDEAEKRWHDKWEREKAERVRLQACVDTCEGVPVEQLEKGLLKRLLEITE